ncbi:MAG: hypothetical protein U0271_14805 [Polyangiaceae bacterium]
MTTRRAVLAASVALVTGPLACDEEPPHQRGTTLDAPDTEAGLADLVGRALTAAKDGDSSVLSSIAESFAFTNAKKFLEGAFDADAAARLSDELSDAALARGAAMREYLRTLAKSGKVAASAHKVEAPNDPDGTGYQSRAIGVMKNKVPLYYVHVSDPADELKATGLWSFVHDGKRFRYVGKLKRISREILGPEADMLAELRIRDAAAFGGKR